MIFHTIIPSPFFAFHTPQSAGSLAGPFDSTLDRSIEMLFRMEPIGIKGMSRISFYLFHYVEIAIRNIATNDPSLGACCHHFCHPDDNIGRPLRTGSAQQRSVSLKTKNPRNTRIRYDISCELTVRL
jgi:hypothetical protein